MQEFSSDMGSRGVKRIADVCRLRISQFPQVRIQPSWHQIGDTLFLGFFVKFLCLNFLFFLFILREMQP